MTRNETTCPTPPDRAAGGGRSTLDLLPICRAARARLAGPGGYYNLGNALCLATSIAIPALTERGPGSGMLAAVVRSLVGNPEATALTAATVIFFWSSEAYHRAWLEGSPPDQRLNRRGDLLTGIGCVVFAAAMLGFGLPVLVAALAVQAAGKFGSAAGLTTLPGWPASWPDPFRTAVLASRFPAIAAAGTELAGLASLPAGDVAWPAVLVPLTLLISYALWVRADLLLFGSTKDLSPVPAVR